MSWGLGEKSIPSLTFEQYSLSEPALCCLLSLAIKGFLILAFICSVLLGV